MKKQVISWIFAAAVPMLLLGAGPAHAGITCKYIPGMCPEGDDPPRHASVPEPATLALLATGFGAAGFAAWRRRKGKE